MSTPADKRYILAPQVGLRSWKRVPHAYVRRFEARPHALPQEEFELACRCDGRRPLPDSPALRSLLQRGLVIPCDSSAPALSPFQELLVCPNRVVPWMALEITERCNYRCLHCFNAQGNEEGRREMSLDEAGRLFDSARRAGVSAVLITGGEPLMHRSFRELVELLYSRGLFVHELNTNGALLTRELLGFLAGFGFKPQIKISFDGLGFHDWMRGCPGAQESALKAIRLCVEEGFPVRVQMSVNRRNQPALLESLALLDAMGVQATRLLWTAPTPRWELNAQGQCLDWGEYLECCTRLLGAYATAGHTMELDAWMVAQLFPRTLSYRLSPVRYSPASFKESRPCCSTANGMVAVGADGQVYPCMQSSGWFDAHDISLGNVHEQGLGAILQEGPYCQMVHATVGDRLAHQGECAACPWLQHCAGGCPALAMLYSGGDYLAPDRAACMFFKGGWPQRIAQALPGWRCLNLAST